MRAFYPLLVLIPLCLASESVLAATNPGARIALHRKAATTSGLCTTYSPNEDQLPCSQYTVTAPAPGASVIYIVAVLADQEAGVKGLMMGIDYDGRDQSVGYQGEPFGISPQVTTFTWCANGLPHGDSGPLGDWPKPQSGMNFSFQQCQNTVINGTVHAVIGSMYVYAYSEDVLRMTPNLNYFTDEPELGIFDCQSEYTDLLNLYPQELWDSLTGKVHFGGDGSKGFNPCAAVPAIPSSWGSMKARFTN